MERFLDILLADDEEIVHKTVAGYLRDLGHNVDKSHDASSTLKFIESHEYDLVIVDIHMPGMNGLSLLSEIQKIRPEMSIVIITGHGNMDMAIQCLKLGASDFLTKPISLLALDAVLEKSIRLRDLTVRYRQNVEALQEKLENTVYGLKKCCLLLNGSVTDVIWITDMDLSFIFVSPAISHMLGYEAEEAMKLSWKEILTPGSMEDIKRTIAEEQSLENIGQEKQFRSRTVEIEMIGKDGSTVQTSSKLTFLSNLDGQPAAILGMSRGIGKFGKAE